MPRRTPVSTYRLQVTAEQDLFAVADLIPYLTDLGVDWVYLSPLLAAEPGSDHGYDVVAHDHLDPARGGSEGLDAVAAAAHEHGLGVLVDIVPNHVGVATPAEDPWWWDVLKHGRGAEHAAAFDVDWDAAGQRLRLPVVGDDDLLPGGRIGHLRLERATGPDGAEDWELHYHDNRYPVAPGTVDVTPPEPGAAPVLPDPDAVHALQHYELVDWHRADDGLNYRRFFAVNTLAAVRVEEPEVFADTHVEIGRWFREGLVDGLRVDHPDGLRDPKGYLDDLADLTGGAYVLVEKILEPGEELPTSWATAGTTGYDVLGQIDRVLVDPAGEAPLDALETRLRGAPVDWAEMVHDNKRAVADTILSSEVRRIVRDLRRHLPTVPAFRAEDAVAEVIACFGVYRSYLPEGREHLEEALTAARARRPDLASTFDVLEPWLHDEDLAAAKRLQQTSGMVMAKGVEDCSFYRWSRLTALNEVGGDPSVFALGPADLHAAMEHRQATRPDAMTATSTHDTKRGEDVRARILAIAEVPDAWESALDELLRLAPLPDPGFGALLWQAAVGAWPLSRERLHAYAEKAMREAGDRTTWTEPDTAYEDAVHAAVDAAYDDPAVAAVVDATAALLAGPGWSNSLSAKLLALALPGVPDVYQGSELWEQSLVDPDNRRGVDFARRRELLAALPPAGPAPAAPQPSVDAGAEAKLHLVRTLLTLRRDSRDDPDRLTSYAGLTARGSAADHVVAFDRGGLVAVATRLPVGLDRAGGWGDTVLPLPPGTWRDALAEGRPGGSDGSDGARDLVGEVRLADLLTGGPGAEDGRLPVAVLVRQESA